MKHTPQAGGSGLEHALQQALAEAQSAWPDLALPALVFVDHLRRRLPSADDVGEALRAVHVADLYLTCACAHHVPGAIEALERRFGADIAAVLGRMGLPADAADEARQVMRERLFVSADGAPPRIGEYSGRGPLGGWLRTVVQRTALNLRRGPRQESFSDEDAAVRRALVPSQDAETSFLKGHYQASFQDAFRDAMELLDPRQRDVLQLYYIDGLNVEEIGALRRVHHSTAARWVIAARAALGVHMQRLLEARLKLSAGEFASIAALLRSRIAVTSALRRPELS